MHKNNIKTMDKEMKNDMTVSPEDLLKMQIIYMTGEQLLQLFQIALTPASGDPQHQEMPQHVYGLKGLAGVLGCSEQTAARYMAQGKLEGAYVQVGKTIITDTRKLMEILSPGRGRSNR